jgi:hypothetical protein
MFDPATKPG